MHLFSRRLARATFVALLACAVTTAALGLAACNGERQAVPDPAIPPKPKVEQAQ